MIDNTNYLESAPIELENKLHDLIREIRIQRGAFTRLKTRKTDFEDIKPIISSNKLKNEIEKEINKLS